MKQKPLSYLILFLWKYWVALNELLIFFRRHYSFTDEHLCSSSAAQQEHGTINFVVGMKVLLWLWKCRYWYMPCTIYGYWYSSLSHGHNGETLVAVKVFIMNHIWQYPSPPIQNKQHRILSKLLRCLTTDKLRNAASTSRIDARPSVLTKKTGNKK